MGHGGQDLTLLVLALALDIGCDEVLVLEGNLDFSAAVLKPEDGERSAIEQSHLPLCDKR